MSTGPRPAHYFTVQGPTGRERSAHGLTQPVFSTAHVAADRQWLLLAHTAVALLSLAAFLTLFLFRAQDDNRLTSWRWVFADADVFWITPALAPGLLLSSILQTSP